MSDEQDITIEPKGEGELIMGAWGLLANVSEGDWTKQTPGWQAAVKNWRQAFHEYLDREYNK